MKIRIKVLERGGKEWMVNSAYKMSFQEPFLTVLFAAEDESTMQLIMTTDEYNAIGYRWFQDVGPAPHGTAVPGEAIKWRGVHNG
jgi:hypothetical protein